MNDATHTLPPTSADPTLTLRNPPRALRRVRVCDSAGRALATLEPGDSADFEATPERRRGGEVVRASDGAPLVRWKRRV